MAGIRWVGKGAVAPCPPFCAIASQRAGAKALLAQRRDLFRFRNSSAGPAKPGNSALSGFRWRTCVVGNGLFKGLIGIGAVSLADMLASRFQWEFPIFVVKRMACFETLVRSLGAF
jgi:hypothetical protein